MKNSQELNFNKDLENVKVKKEAKYITGFLIGFIFSFIGFTLFNNKSNSKKFRLGLSLGCFLNIIIIICLAILYLYFNYIKLKEENLFYHWNVKNRN